ncbi:MAG: saccharopine dehydrogenase family protein [Thermoplasmata archaeon]
MKVIVLGCGMMGKEVASDLLETGRVSSLTVGDFNLAKAEQYVREEDDERLTAERVDVTDRGHLVPLLRRFDLAINATWYELNMHITRGAIESGIDYLDLGGLYRFTKKQMELDGQAKAAGVTVAIGCGSSPGLTNVLARHAADRMEKVEEIHIRAGGVQLERKPRFAFGYSIRTILDELLLNPVLYRNGEYVEVEPLSGEETLTFPEPLGDVRFIHTLHSEIATLPTYINKGIRLVEFKVAFPTPMLEPLKTLINLGMLGEKPVAMKGVEIKPSEFVLAYFDSMTVERASYAGVTRVEVVGMEEGRRTRRILQMIKKYKPGERGLTGIVASTVSQMLGGGEIETKGVVPPEACVPPNRMIRALLERGFSLQETVIKELI